jgi:cytochrome oxidase Cu insertion factor (SCO1/SenC/PrrC family)
MSEKTRSRTSLWLIVALCVAPVAASYFAFYFARPSGHINYGELIGARALPIEPLRLDDGAAFQLSELHGRWILLMADASACDEYCRRKLYTLRQLRLAQGKDSERIERVWLIADRGALSAALVHDYPGTWFVRAAGSALLAQLPVERALPDHIYIVDPLGNLVLRYPRDADPRRIIKDVTRLLQTSRIG